MLFGVEKRLHYDLLTSTPQPVYNIENYFQQQIHVFSKIHSSVREKLTATKAKKAMKHHLLMDTGTETNELKPTKEQRQ